MHPEASFSEAGKSKTQARLQSKNPLPGDWQGVFKGSLTITYFHTGIRTIIGVESFHGPVRDGKGWFQLAMVIRHNLYVPLTESAKPIRKKRSTTLGCDWYRHRLRYSHQENTLVIGSSLTGN